MQNISHPRFAEEGNAEEDVRSIRVYTFVLVTWLCSKRTLSFCREYFLVAERGGRSMDTPA